MNSPVLLKYAEIKNKIVELEKERIALELEVIEEFDRWGEQELKTSVGNFNLGSRRTYQYSPKIDTMKEKLLEAKHLEESNGEAQLVKHSQFVVFRPNK